jgi:hypothetical protein
VPTERDREGRTLGGYSALPHRGARLRTEDPDAARKLPDRDTAQVNVVPLARLARERNLDPSAVDVLRAILAAEGLLVDDGVDGATLPAVRPFLDQALSPTCGNAECDGMAPRLCGGAVVHTGAARCCVCGGSVNERARARIYAACVRSGARNLVVVGGSPRSREEIAGDGGRWDRLVTAPLGIEWRLVDGSARHTEIAARANIAWADLVVIWGPTQLGHKVSILYTGPGGHARTVTCGLRGFGALADTIVRGLER